MHRKRFLQWRKACLYLLLGKDVAKEEKPWQDHEAVEVAGKEGSGLFKFSLARRKGKKSKVTEGVTVPSHLGWEYFK